MEVFTLARVLHVVAIVVWIGGVFMVTTVIIPAVKRMARKEEQIDTFEKIEGRFAAIAKVATLVTAITGFYMIYEMNAWDRYLDGRYWWMHAMTIIWVLFSVVLFILEPVVLHRLFKKYAQANPVKTFAIMHRAHWVLLILSLMTIAGTVAAVHGWHWF